MRYGLRGDLAAGVGIINVDRVDICQGYFLCWIDPDTFISNSPGETKYNLFQHRRSNGWQPEFLDKRGGTRAGGGLGNYAVYAATQPDRTYYGKFNGELYPPYFYEWQGLPALDGSDDGRLLLVSGDYQQLVMVQPGGNDDAFYTGPHVNLSTPRLVKGGFVYLDESYHNTMLFRQIGAEPKALVCYDTPFTPKTFEFDGRRWLFYHNNATFLHPEGSTLGYKFDASYAPDTFIDDNGFIHVALTYSPGEGSETITLISPFRLGDGMMELVGTPTPIPPEPKPPIVVPPNPIPKPPVELKMKSDFVVTELHNLQDITEVPHPQGQGTVALKKSNGKYVNLSPEGKFGESDNAGSWERFLPGGGGWYAYRNDSNRWFVVTSRVPVWP